MIIDYSVCVCVCVCAIHIRIYIQVCVCVCVCVCVSIKSQSVSHKQIITLNNAPTYIRKPISNYAHQHLLLFSRGTSVRHAVRSPPHSGWHCDRSKVQHSHQIHPRQDRLNLAYMSNWLGLNVCVHISLAIQELEIQNSKVELSNSLLLHFSVISELEIQSSKVERSNSPCSISLAIPELEIQSSDYNTQMLPPA